MASSFNSASASTSTSTADGNNCYKFDVFLNHRGPDVKKTFATDLYNRLKKHRLQVFLDVEEMKKGDKLISQIEGAIKSASVHIAIFSINYAHSKWCLDELVLMLESTHGEKKSTILPVFFGVKPSELRWTEGEKGVYAQALRSLQNKRTIDSLQPRYDSSTIRKWKEALHDVAEISGFELDEAPYNGDNGKLLADVVERVLEIVPKPPLHVSKFRTGLDGKVKDFERVVLLQTEQESGKARVVGIVGLGGIGKTTLAKEFFNRQQTNYRRSCFLSDVRENYCKGSLNSLQSILIKELTQRDVKINSTDEGISYLKKHLIDSQVLIIFDDVDHIDQLDALLSPAKDALGSSSLIIVTSRDKGVLIRWGIEDLFIYKLKGLNPQHSTELFCWHAFNQPHPVAGFDQVLEEFVDACDGLPLSIKVIGALLYGEDNLEHWKAQLRKISKIPPKDIQNTLRISYDSLDEEEKQMFLDIACFLIGEDKDTAIRIWDGSGWEGSLGFQNLHQKNLVEVEDIKDIDVSLIRMHDQLRDLGRYLAHKESPRRIWRVSDNLLDKSPVCGVKNVEERNRLVAELKSASDKGSCVETVFSIEQSEQLILIRCYNCTYSSLASKILVKNLRVLYVKGQMRSTCELERLWHESEAPLQLRELYIDGCSLPKIPESIAQLEHLEKITFQRDVCHSLETLPDAFCQLRYLKHFELQGCVLMKSLPDSFGNLTNLQHINLSYCEKMQMLPNSFGKLTKLQHINLGFCEELQLLPNSFGNLTKLQYIDLSYCKELQMLPNSFGNLIQLLYLYLTGCVKLSISEETLGKIVTLQLLDLAGCGNIKVLPPQLTEQLFLRQLFMSYDFKKLPRSIGNLRNLKYFSLESSCLEMLPRSFSSLKSLEKLRFVGLTWECLPYSIGMLTQLKIFEIVEMNKLELLELKECPSRVKRMPVKRTNMQSKGQGALSKLDAFPVFPNLQDLRIYRSDSLVEVGALPTTLTNLVLMTCPRLIKIGGLCTLSKLQTLYVYRCKELELPTLETLVSLESLKTHECGKLKRIQGLSQLTKLRILDVWSCSELEELPGVEHLRSLKMVSARGCPKLQWDEEMEWLRQKGVEVRV